MFKAEELEEFSSVKIKEYRSGSRKVLSRPRQKGSILIGLIVTMVVMASLGAGMVYLTTTSTFQELFANNHARAYYLAESGGRYVTALARQALATSNPTLASLNTAFSGVAPSTGNFTMANGKFQIENWVEDNGGLNGSKQISFDSTGTVNSGFLQAKRKLHYKINPSNQSGGGYTGPPALPSEASDFSKPTGGGSDAAWLAQYYASSSGITNDETKIFSISTDNALNLASPFYTMGLGWYDNPLMAQLDAVRTNNGGLLSYGVQVKINIDVKAKDDDYSMTGISFRLDDTTLTTGTPPDVMDNMYGISFYKIKALGNHTPVEWYNSTTTISTTWKGILVNDDTWYVVLWKRVGGASSLHTLLAYKQLSDSDWVYDSSGTVKIKSWSTIKINVEEKIAASGDPYFSAGTRYNVITSHLAADSQGTTNLPLSSNLYHRNTTASPQTIEWSGTKFKPINWTVITGGAAGTTGTNIVADKSLTTLNYSSYTSTTDPKAREIGLHVYYDSQSAKNVFYDNFYVDLSPSTGGGGADGGGGVSVSP